MRTFELARLFAGASLFVMASAGAAAAADQNAPAITGAGAEGTEYKQVVVTAERNMAAAQAPSKGSLDETQPESIITRPFIELATPEAGDWTTTAQIAPGVSGITSNGGGDIGEYNKLSMRGFKDGLYNLTFDGIAFGDTNDPTHHSASYFPASTIGAVVIDRGPGAAGDLGQANLGGAIHFFSLVPDDKFGISQKLTYGSFNTVASVTTFNSGPINWLNGSKLLINLDERQSDGELTHSGGYATNQIVKFVAPLTDKATLTLFGQHEYTRFYLADAGPGLTWAQAALYGKNFALNDNPNDEHYYKYNYEGKGSDFYYADVKGEITPGLAGENQLYTYYYSNKTTAANDLTGLVGGTNTSVLTNTLPALGPTAKTAPNDIGGYDKLNLYRVNGDIVRLNKDLPFGTLKVGGLVEWSSTDRHNGFEDLSRNGAPDLKFGTLNPPTQWKLQENSSWLQYQGFVDFNWRPTDQLTISPGFKYVDFTRRINAANESVAGGAKNQPLVGANHYTSPLYFITANYKVMPDLAVYAQAATSFLIPSLSALYVAGVSLQGLKPETATTYQGGVVYTHGNITVDGDAYEIDVANLSQSCLIPDPTPGNPAATTSGFCNLGNARFNGVEGEGAYAFPFGLAVFVNGSLGSAKNLANAGNAAAGIAPSVAGSVPNAPKFTDAFGAIYRKGPWEGSVTYKQSGNFLSSGGSWLPGYDTINAAVAYDFGRFKLKLQGLNLADRRAIVDTGAKVLYSMTDPGLYTFQAGREFQATIQAKF